MTNSKQLLIALSAGGSDTELAADGIGMEHIDELMVRLSMRLLEAGNHLAFGGTMGDKDKRLTENLIITGQRWSENKESTSIDVNNPSTWPIVNYSSWDFYNKIDPAHRANLVGLCHFIEVDPVWKGNEKTKQATDSALRKRLLADALTIMRRRASADSQVRIVWGGKIKGSSGWMAGILEEVACSLERNQAILILGGFGGCSKLIGQFLLKATAPWPKDLSLEACADPERDAALSAEQSKELRHRFIEVQDLLKAYRNQLHNQTTVNNLPTDKLISLLTVDNPRQAIQTVAELLEGYCSKT